MKFILEHNSSNLSEAEPTNTFIKEQINDNPDIWILLPNHYPW